MLENRGLEVTEAQKLIMVSVNTKSEMEFNWHIIRLASSSMKDTNFLKRKRRVEDRMVQIPLSSGRGKRGKKSQQPSLDMGVKEGAGGERWIKRR